LVDIGVRAVVLIILGRWLVILCFGHPTGRKSGCGYDYYMLARDCALVPNGEFGEAVA
jgi:hypothetical protein